MPLIHGDQSVKNEDSTKTWHKGTVVDNKDPKKKGRVKCIIPGFFEGDKDSLPWCYPLGKSGMGGSTSGTFYVPNEGDELVISFPYADKNMPVYSGHWESETSHPVIFDDDYGNSGGTAFDDGSWFKYNKEAKTAEYRHPSGAFIFIDSSGGVYIQAVSDLGIHTKGNLYLGGDQGVLLESEAGPIGLGSGQDIALMSSGNIGLKAPGLIVREASTISDEATGMVVHNCGISDVTSSTTAGVVKKIGSTIKSALTSAAKKFECISKTSEAKKQKTESMKNS